MCNTKSLTCYMSTVSSILATLGYSSNTSLTNNGSLCLVVTSCAVAMAFSGSSFTAIPPSHLSHIETRRIQPFQIKCKGNSDSDASEKVSLSRRDAIICLTAFSSSALGIYSPEVAEARVSKAEMRRKIKEKLELLREKAGLSKQKDDKGKSPPPPSFTKKENNLPLQPSPLPLPDPPLGLNRSLVEATYDH